MLGQIDAASSQLNICKYIPINEYIQIYKNVWTNRHQLHLQQKIIKICKKLGTNRPHLLLAHKWPAVQYKIVAKMF